jgi:hypothetical protein
VYYRQEDCELYFQIGDDLSKILNEETDGSAFGQLLRKMQARRKRNEIREQGLQRWMEVGRMKIGR